MTIKDQLNYNRDVIQPKLDAEDANVNYHADAVNISGGSISGVIEEAAVTARATDGAIATYGLAVLTKGSAGAYTLAAPGASDDGRMLIITAGTAFAHVVTATDLIDDGVTGGAKDTMTFAAFKGASIHLIAYGQKWHVVAKNLVTVAAV